MKRRLFTFALAALTIGLLGSCSKINERIDGLDNRVGNIENEKIASIENQIAAINASIADLGTIRKDILDLQVAVGAKGEDIAELKAADEALGKRIDELQTYVDTKLAKYATTEWANATFATLEQLKTTNTELGALKETVGNLGETFDGKLSDLKTELTNAINTAVSNLETRISALEARVSALEQMIQSVTIVPAYNDGSVEVVNGILTLKCIVSPAEALTGMESLKDSLLIYADSVKVKTKATTPAYMTIEVSEASVLDAAQGAITLKANISKCLPKGEGKALTVAVNIKNGISDFTTEFVPVTATKIPTFKAVYNTNGDANTLTFYYDANDHSGEGITVYEDGTDKFLFDDTKTKGAKWGYDGKRGEIKSVVIDASVAGYKGLTSTAYMFEGMNKASSISGAEHLDVSNVTDMSWMFQKFGGGSSGDPTTLNSVPNVSGWDTGKVTDMSLIFAYYGHNSELDKVPDVRGWDTGNVTNMTGVFAFYGYNSSMLDKVPDVSGWNTGNVTDMHQMFKNYGHESQTFNAVPDVSNWNTGNVTNMANIFYEYGHKSTALNTVPDVSGWNTGNVTNMQQMFWEYGNASTNISCVLDLSEWNLSKITGTNGKEVFKFNPKTFKVTIPAKTGEKSNEGGKWYYGDGTNSIAPPEGKTFTPASTISTIADVLATAGDNAPSAANHWNDTKGNYIYVDGGNLLVHISAVGGDASVNLDSTVTPNGDNYLYSEGVLSFTFNMTEGVLTSIYVNCSMYGVNDTFSPAPAASIAFDENPFEPGNIKAIQTLTIKGKNLDLVTKVIFCDNVEVTNFKSQSSEQIVIEKFPVTARTGKVTLVNGTTSQEVTSDVDLVVAQPSVSEIYQFTGVTPYQKLTINGENFDLVYDAIIGDDTYLDYTVKNEGHTIEITMPDEVHDGTVKVIAYSGVEVTVATVTAASAAGVSGNGTEQYKNNSNPDWF